VSRLRDFHIIALARRGLVSLLARLGAVG